MSRCEYRDVFAEAYQGLAESLQQGADFFGLDILFLECCNWTEDPLAIRSPFSSLLHDISQGIREGRGVG